MPTTDDYLLSFDFSEFNRQISDVSRSYTEFGATVKRIASEAGDDVRVLTEQADGLSSSLLRTSGVIDDTYELMEKRMEGTSTVLADIADSSKKLESNLASMMTFNVGGLAGMTAVDQDAIDEALGTAEEAGVRATAAAQVAKRTAKEVEESEEKVKEDASKITQLVQKEMTGAKSAMGGILGRLPISFGGGVIGGLLGMILLGVQERDRIQRETGEMLNIFEATGENFFKGMSQKAVGWFSKFQERAQYFFGIGRKEVQSVVKTFVDAGYKSTDIMDVFDKRLGLVGSNVATLTLGLDKHLNLATGTAAQNVTKLVADYGDSLDDAADKYMNLSLAAQRSGIGINKFIDSVMSGSQALTQYGIDMQDVVHVMGQLQGYYEDMGLKEQFAGTQAAGSLAGMVSGIANMGPGIMTVIAQRLFPDEGTPYEAKQRFQAGWARIAEGRDEGFLVKVVKEAVAFAREQTGGERAETIEFLQRGGLAPSFQAATAMFDISDNLKEGVAISEGTHKQLRNLRKAFMTEGKQLSDLQKTQRDLIRGLKTIGEGMLKMLVGLLGAVVAGIRAIPQLFKAMVSDDPEKALTKISDNLQAQTDLFGAGVREAMEGAEDLKGTFLGRILGQFKPLADAFKTDVELPRGKTWTDIPESIAARGARDLGVSEETIGAAGEVWEGAGRSLTEFATEDIPEAAGAVGKGLTKGMEWIRGQSLNVTGVLFGKDLQSAMTIMEAELEQ